MSQIKVEKVERNPFISSGNVELDAKLGGGLPFGALTLIEGESGSGKSVLTQQILWGALQQGLRVVAFTSENTVKSLIYQMQSIDLDVLDFLLLSKLRIYPMQLSRLGTDAIPSFLSIMQEYIDFDVMVIDSLTSKSILCI
jgi:flagellar protein FlaH